MHPSTSRRYFSFLGFGPCEADDESHLNRIWLHDFGRRLARVFEYHHIVFWRFQYLPMKLKLRHNGRMKGHITAG
jgi:hypothetical protein